MTTGNKSVKRNKHRGHTEWEHEWKWIRLQRREGKIKLYETVWETYAGNKHLFILKKINKYLMHTHRPVSECTRVKAYDNVCVYERVEEIKKKKRILRHLHWDCSALHPVQSLCWIHYLLSVRMGLLLVCWGESKSPHVLHPPLYPVLLLLDPWSLLHAPASSVAQVAQPERTKSVNKRHLCCFKSRHNHQI